MRTLDRNQNIEVVLGIDRSVQGKRLIIGIDPGLDGAIAFLQSDGQSEVIDTPTITVQKTKGKKREYDLAEMVRMIGRHISPGRSITVGLEHVHAMPGQGVTSMWSMGYGSGAWEGIIAALGLPLTRISPQKWQKVMLNGMKGKEGSRLRAIQLFPEINLSRKKDHGKADALLIAAYLRDATG